MPNWCPTLSTTMGVIDGIHRYTADRPTPQPALRPATNGEVLMVYVPHLSEGSPAGNQDHPEFRRKANAGARPSAINERGASGQLTAALPGCGSIVDNTSRILQRQCITYLMSASGPDSNDIPQPKGC